MGRVWTAVSWCTARRLPRTELSGRADTSLLTVIAVESRTAKPSCRHYWPLNSSLHHVPSDFVISQRDKLGMPQMIASGADAQGERSKCSPYQMCRSVISGYALRLNFEGKSEILTRTRLSCSPATGAFLVSGLPVVRGAYPERIFPAFPSPVDLPSPNATARSSMLL